MNTVKSAPSRPLQYLKAIAGSGLPTGTRATCWAIASFADNVSGEAWPTVKTLAEATGLSEAVVSKHTGTAESKGYLRKRRRTNTSIMYTITVPTGEGASTQSPAEEAPEPPPWIKDIVDDIEAGP